LIERPCKFDSGNNRIEIFARLVVAELQMAIVESSRYSLLAGNKQGQVRGLVSRAGG
jgi:hypothetical protein